MIPAILWIPAALILLSAVALALYRLKRRRDVLARRARGVHWSIGCEQSTQPLSWTANPLALLTRHDLGPNAFNLADPFLLEHAGERRLFFEVVDVDGDRGRIDVARWDADGTRWIHEGTALQETFHLSYPHVFVHDDEVYMLPEAKQSGAVRLYKAHDFPFGWKLEKELLTHCKWVDPTPLFWQGRWYCFVSRRRTLHLFMADTLAGPWTAHPQSPVRHRNHARCAGRILVHEGTPYRFAQEQRRYGAGLHAFRIDTLTPTTYRETAVPGNPLLEPSGTGWNAEAMHHIDILREADGGFFAVYDGEGLIRH